MKKLIITVVFTLTAALTGMTTWAAAISSGTIKKDFSSGSTLSSTEMNTNFTVIENAVNATNSLTTTLPDGVSTYLSFYLDRPYDYTAGADTEVISYWSGCEGTVVSLGHLTRGFSVGSNAFLIGPPALSSMGITIDPGVLTYTISESVHNVVGGFGTSDYMIFTLGREGGNVLDTCTGDLTLSGVYFRYPSAAVNRRISIPVNTLAR